MRHPICPAHRGLRIRESSSSSRSPSGPPRSPRLWGMRRILRTALKPPPLTATFRRCCESVGPIPKRMGVQGSHGITRKDRHRLRSKKIGGPAACRIPHAPHSMGAFSFQWASTPTNTESSTGQNPSNQPITTKPPEPINPSTTRKRPLKKKYAHAAADRLLRTSPAPCLISCALPQRGAPPPAAPAAPHLARGRTLHRRPRTAASTRPTPRNSHHVSESTPTRPTPTGQTHSRTHSHAYSGLMSNARYRKSRCNVSRFSATVSSLVMCVIPVNGKYVCSRPAAISACESRSEWAMVTLSSEKP